MTTETTISMTDYVRDNVGAPSPTLNSGLAHRLLTRSPLHAWYSHPKLNPDWKPTESEAFDLGTAAHDRVIDGHGDRIVVVDAPDWRTKDAREKRDAARAEGKLPLLPHQAAAVEAMAEPVAEALLSDDLIALGPLDAEQTFVWRDPVTGAWCRCRPDWVTKDRTIIISYKTVSGSAEPGAFVRTILNFGYAMQMAFELYGVGMTAGTTVSHYVWLVQETAPPYAVSLVGMNPEMRAYGESLFAAATAKWAECLGADTWPAYPSRICYVDLPPWAMAAAEALDAAD